jgi:hypothetical protein
MIFAGCSTYEQVLKKDKVYHNSLIYTKKADIVNSFETKAIISATFLNSVDSLYKNSSNFYFLVSIYISDDNKDIDEKGIYNKDYKLTLANKEAISISEVEDANLKASMIPFYNKWAKYYIVEFERFKKDREILTFSHKEYGSKVLDFTQNGSKIF